MLFAGWAVTAFPLHGASSCTAPGTGATSTTCAQNSAITTVSASGGGVPVAGNVYPSIINVPANTLSGTVTRVAVKLNGLSHTVGGVDLAFLLVSPSGKALIFMGGMGAFKPHGALNLTFDDTSGTTHPCDFTTAAASGTTYKPRVCDASVPSQLGGFPSDAGNGWKGCSTNQNCPLAGPAGIQTLNSVFSQETAPNGNWKLYMRDTGTSAGTGTVGAWQLTITTSGAASSATVTSISTLSPATVYRTPPGASDAATIRVAVTSSGRTVNGGTVSFTDNDGPLSCTGGNAPVTAGIAVCNATFAAEGLHQIRATYSGTAGLAASNTAAGSFLMVNDRSAVTNLTTSGGRFCNNGGITLPASGAPLVYPSNLYVTSTGAPAGANAFAGVITGLTVSLDGFRHTAPFLTELLLVSPAGKAYILMGNAYQGGASSGPANMILSDAAESFVPATGGIGAGTFKPADYNATKVQDSSFFANRNASAGTLFNPFPAPVVGYFFPGGAELGSSTILQVFGPDSANGNWRLYAINSADGNPGAIAGWCLNFADK